MPMKAADASFELLAQALLGEVRELFRGRGFLSVSRGGTNAKGEPVTVEPGDREGAVADET